jgi:Fe2+ or Zn2+ uptake regulation protein
MQLRIIPKKKSGIQADALRARGKRLTRPRRLILDLVRGTDAHPSAALVYREVRPTCRG